MSKDFPLNYFTKDIIPPEFNKSTSLHLDENSNKQVITGKLDILNAFVNHLRNVSAENNGDVHFALKNIKIFLANLKLGNDNYNIFKKNTLIDQATKSQSLLSMVDINMVILDEKKIDKSISLNEDQSLVPKYKSRPTTVFRETSSNTDEKELIDKSSQTKKPVKQNSYDRSRDMSNLKMQCDAVKQLMVTLMAKNDMYSNTKDTTYNTMCTVVDYYKTYFDDLKKVCHNAESQTTESWLNDWESVGNDCNEYDTTIELLEEVLRKSEELEERIHSQTKEVESQFEMIEDLTTKNADLRERNDLLHTDLIEINEMNEFLESENKSLICSIEKLQADLRATKKLNDQKMKELNDSFRTSRCRWLVERRINEQKSVDQQRDFTVTKYEHKYQSDRLGSMTTSVQKFLEFDEGYEQLTMEEKDKIRVLEKELASDIKEYERGDAVIKGLRRGNAAEKADRVAKVDSLTAQVDHLDNGLKSLTQQNAIYRLCLLELRTMNLNSKERSSHIDAELCREILARCVAALSK